MIGPLPIDGRWIWPRLAAGIAKGCCAPVRRDAATRRSSLHQTRWGISQSFGGAFASPRTLSGSHGHAAGKAPCAIRLVATFIQKTYGGQAFACSIGPWSNCPGENGTLAPVPFHPKFQQL